MLAELLVAAALGREIYHHGRGAAEITAAIGETRVPASALVCSSCHGADGRGRAEGGVAPADVRYAMLTRPYDVTAPGGRTRKPYDDRLIRRAITMGVDSSGNRLSEVMPRYEMTREDLDALMAYLRTLGDEAVPGVSDTTIRAGVILPPPPRDAAVRAAVERWVRQFNESGGAYGRTIEVAFDPAGEVFAYFASFTDGAAKPEDVPLLSAFDSDPDLTAPHARYLLPGLTQQARALALFAAERGDAVVIDERFASEARAAGLTVANTSGAIHLHLASSGGAAAFDAKGIEHAIAFPALAAKSLHESAALASAAIFAAALRGAGGDLTRERFLDAVDRIHALDTAHGPITYRGRRIGTGGVWILPIDREGREGRPRFVKIAD